MDSSVVENRSSTMFPNRVATGPSFSLVKRGSCSRIMHFHKHPSILSRAKTTCAKGQGPDAGVKSHKPQGPQAFVPGKGVRDGSLFPTTWGDRTMAFSGG